MSMLSVAYIGGFGSGFSIALAMVGLFLSVRAWVNGRAAHDAGGDW